ncbi:MAG: penicillin acylase family protein [Candidatus Solibacter sp.]|nr:penicillin acylase family protein [Candidatus Solibacter sp.]
MDARRTGFEDREQYQKWNAADPARATELSDLVAALREWDQVARIDSVPATLFVRLETRARVTPDSPDALVAALEKVKAELEAAFGTWRVAWGDVNRLQRVHTSGTLEPFRDDRPSVPVPGAPSVAGTVFTVGAREAPGQKRMYGTVGNTYIAVVEFGRKVQARSLLVFGETADPASPHYFDQAGLYSRQQFKPAWFDLGEIKRHLEKRYRP